MKRYWDRRDFLKTVGAGMAALPLARLGRAGAAPDKQPNIIFIMADDMGYGDLDVYGQEHIEMPRVDQMAREGIRYTDVYAGAPVCAPSRSVLMTGQHTGHTRVRGNMSNVEDHGAVACPFRGEGAWRVPLLEEDTTVADVLKEAGYVTGITGKWGLGEAGTPGVPNKQGFDEWLGFLNQARAHSYYPEYIWENQERLHLEGNTGTREDFDTEEVYVHDLFTDFALDFIERHGPEETPFFLYLPYTIPHARWQIPELEPYTEDTDWSEEMKVYASMLTGWIAMWAAYWTFSRSWILTKTPSCSSVPTTALRTATKAGSTAPVLCAATNDPYTTAASARSWWSGGPKSSRKTPLARTSGTSRTCCPRVLSWPASHRRKTSTA